MFIRIDGQVMVAGQIAPEDIAEAAAQGVRHIVNNRPDGEAFGQPECAVMRAAAEAAGLAYTPIPIDHSGFSMPQVEAMATVLASGEPVLAYCRSGTRSTLLWALAKAHGGGDPGDISDAAAAAGYDVSPVAGALRQLSTRA
jgi:uncharacterized protein (TIGR01244 family)